MVEDSTIAIHAILAVFDDDVRIVDNEVSVLVRLNGMSQPIALNHTVLDGELVVRPHTVDNRSNASTIFAV